MNCDLKSLASDSFQSMMGSLIEPEHQFYNENAAETDTVEVVFTPDQENHTKGEISAKFIVTVGGKKLEMISDMPHVTGIKSTR